MSAKSLYHYRAKIVRIADSDTIDAELDLGFDITLKVCIHLVGINTPESQTKDPEERAAGLAAKDYVGKWLLRTCGNRCIIETKLDGRGKSGRVLGRVLSNDGICLNDLLLAEGHAVPCDSSKR